MTIATVSDDIVYFGYYMLFKLVVDRILNFSSI